MLRNGNEQCCSTHVHVASQHLLRPCSMPEGEGTGLHGAAAASKGGTGAGGACSFPAGLGLWHSLALWGRSPHPGSAILAALGRSPYL